MSDSFQSYVFGKALHAATAVVVSIFQAGLVTLAVLSFSLLAMFVLSLLADWFLPAMGGASYRRDVGAEAFAVLPDWMGRLEAGIAFVGMPISVFLSLLSWSSRTEMWLCVSAMIAMLIAIEVVAVWNGGHGFIFVLNDAGLAVFLLLLMSVQLLGFRVFLWAAGLKTLAPKWPRV